MVEMDMEISNGYGEIILNDVMTKYCCVTLPQSERRDYFIPTQN